MRCRFALLAFFFCILAHAQQSGTQTDSLAIYLKNGIELFQAKGYSAALPLLKKSRSIIAERKGTEDKTYKQLACFIGCCCYYTSECSEALSYLSEYERYSELHTDSAAMHTVNTLISLCHFQQRNYAEALPYCERVLADAKGKENAVDIYKAFVPLSIMICAQLGDYERGVKISEAADAHCKKLLGSSHPAYQELRSNFAITFTATGYPETALKFMGTGSENRKALHDSTRINILNFEALTYIGNAQYEKGIQKADSALALCKGIKGEHNKMYADLLGTKAICHMQLQDFGTTIPLIKKSLGIYETLGMQSSSSYVNACTNLILAMSTDDIEKHANDLLKYTKSTYALIKKHFPAGSDEELHFVSTCINFLFWSKNYKLAAQFQEQYFKQIKKRTKAHSTEYMGELMTLATFKMAANEDISPLLPDIKNAYQIISSRHGKLYYQHRTYTSLLLDYYTFAGLYKEAKKYALDLLPTTNEQIRQSFLYLSTQERTALWDKNSYLYYQRLPFLCLRLKNDADIAKCAYDAQLMSKNLLLAAETDFKELLLSSGDDEALKLFGELQATQQKLNKLYESPAETGTTILDSLEQAVFRQEKKLINRSKLYGDYTQNLRVNWKDVQKKLGAQDIAVEFFSVDLGNDSTLYAALTLTKTDKTPQAIPLFEQKELERIKKENYYQSGELASLIIRPIQERLNGMKNIYFAPAGELHNIAIENIPHWDNAAQLSDHWNFYRLSSTRELALTKNRKEAKNATIYGGLHYNTNLEVLIANNKKHRSRAIASEAFNIADSLNLRAGVQYLPATKQEAIDIEQILRQKNIRTTLYSDTTGTEASFKAFSGESPNILHIATHGFYWTAQEAKSMNNLRFLIENKIPGKQKHIDDQELSRSGLILAGANLALKGRQLPENIDDGILTAKEIAALNLNNLDLVVLSACQTGLGDIKGDGVFGLQRGFKKAGAGTLMMSLWKVDDNATKLLMSRFYSNLTTGLSKYNALKEAQHYVRDYEMTIEVRNEQRLELSARQREQNQNNETPIYKKIKPYQAPQYWAAFILLDAL